MLDESGTALEGGETAAVASTAEFYSFQNRIFCWTDRQDIIRVSVTLNKKPQLMHELGPKFFND